MFDSANDQSTTFQYNPANQITELTRSNDNYAWTGHVNVDRDYTVNGLNQLITAGGLTLNYDNSGNLQGDGSNTYSYDVENRLLGVTGNNNATLSYVPLGRLNQTIGSGITTRFGYDGADMIAEYNATGAITRRAACAELVSVCMALAPMMLSYGMKVPEHRINAI